MEPPLTARSQEQDRGFADAASAVRDEHRACSQSLVLRCHRAQRVGTADGGVYALDITRFATLDWSWEGARAFACEASAAGEGAAEGGGWTGDVVGLDEVASKLFVRVEGPGPAPTIGDFVVQPFDFVAALRALYDGELTDLVRGPLTDALARAAGRAPSRGVALPCPDPVLQGVWDRDWGYVWGPPGTGKTYTVGEQVASALASADERILVVSTTNLATDAVAISIARGLRARNREPSPAMLRRMGSGVSLDRLKEHDLAQIADVVDEELRAALSQLLRRHRLATSSAERAELWARISELRRKIAAQRESIATVDARVVVTTAFLGVRALAHPEAALGVAQGDRPFTTVVIDEAGLISRVAAAALSLWSSRRVVVVGDPKQLSPISKISRVLEPRRARWLGRSAIHHLNGEAPGVRLLRTQRRMHPDIRRVVSEFLYAGLLDDGPEVLRRPDRVPPDLAKAGRAIWYVLDEDAGGHLAYIRADRGAGGRSWCRRRSREVLERLFRAHPELSGVDGLFVTPFVAQARDAQHWLAMKKHERWNASTAHAQQGLEADIVVFDTVNAGSTGWSHDEWQRLINVAISRGRQALIVLASRLEASEPYLRPLRQLLAPRVLRGSGGRLVWTEVPANAEDYRPSEAVREAKPDSLGAQLEQRKSMRAVLGSEQQRLCGLSLDGKPRLVRGVAGSGKTVVLAHWLARSVAQAQGSGPFWVVFANKALVGLIEDLVDQAWRACGREGPFPWDAVEKFHVVQLFDRLEAECGIRSPSGAAGYDFERRAAAILAHQPAPRCGALFVDEAQDFGDRTLALLAQLVSPSDPARPGERSVNIFYDNAQNLYGRGTPKWVDLGLDMQGRSSVMKESYRSTRPAAEFALNVLYRLAPPDDDPDHKELVQRDLLHKTERQGRPWWVVRFNDIDGPPPEFRWFRDPRAELRALAGRVSSWIHTEGVRPRDIMVVVNSSYRRKAVVAELRRSLAPLGVSVEERTRGRFDRGDGTVVVTTPHSAKGHDAEIVAVPFADEFVAKVGGEKAALAAALYVAMTRARSVLYVSASGAGAGTSPSAPSAKIVEALRRTQEDQRSVDPSVGACTQAEELQEILERIGPAHRLWLEDLAKRHRLHFGPICRADGSVVAEPLFYLGEAPARLACLPHDVGSFVRAELEDLGVRVLEPGAGVS